MSFIARGTSRIRRKFAACLYARTYASESNTPMPRNGNGPLFNSPVDINPKRPGTIMDVFTTSTTAEEQPLPARFAQIKKEICNDPEAMMRGWRRVLKELEGVSEEIGKKGGDMIPYVSFEDICQGLKGEQLEAVKKTGVVVVRGAVPEDVSIQSELSTY